MTRNRAIKIAAFFAAMILDRFTGIGDAVEITAGMLLSHGGLNANSTLDDYAAWMSVHQGQHVAALCISIAAFVILWIVLARVALALFGKPAVKPPPPPPPPSLADYAKEV